MMDVHCRNATDRRPGRTFKLHKEKNLKNVNQAGLVSKRMHAYLVSKKLWPEKLLRSTEIPSG
ncbi:MAG TPA: hypothetical protein VFS12_04465 [Terriglobia bacterium]|nr:hypothetical protein [Terriglobia bacterium]